MSKTEDDLIKMFGGMFGGDSGTAEDTMPEGYGEFGLEVTNPIPTQTPVGSRTYLEQLHTADGVKVDYERIGSMRAPNIPYMIDGYRIFANSREVATLYICPYNKKNSERAPKGFTLGSSKNKPVFFDIPKAGAGHQKVQSPQNPFKPQKIKRSTKINGFTLNGGVVWTAIKYFFWSIAITATILILMEYQWNLLSDTPSSKIISKLPLMVLLTGMIFITYGIVSLVRRRFKAFAEFLLFLVNIALLCFVIKSRMMVENVEILSTLDRVSYCIIAFCALFLSFFRLSVLKNVSTRESYQMNSAMLRLGGTPSVIFFTYLLRTMTLPLIVASVIWVFGLSISPTWKAVFSIYGAILAWDVIRMMVYCNLIRYKKDSFLSEERKKYYSWSFWLLHIYLLFLPGLGLFLMWYFDWLPMKTWLIWVYVIYGLFWLWMAGGLLLAKKQNQ
jgi:hypothetical protein